MALPPMETLQRYLQQTPEYEAQPNWMIKQSPVRGRGLFATQTIPQGTLIFVNNPLVVGPRSDQVDGYCTVCYKTSDNCSSCDKCSLTVCLDKCVTSAAHAKECTFITENWVPKQKCERNSNILASVLTQLRFLILTEDEMLLLNNLQRSEKQKWKELDILCSEFVVPDKQMKFMNEMGSVLKINSFRISDDCGQKRIPLRGLYLLSSFINHSCVPNTRYVFKSDHSMAVYATRDIEIGEELLGCYTGLLWCTPTRRYQLFMTKEFWCKCVRCEDATEMGTRLSALKCLNKECIGVLLPVNPLDIRSEWKCDICEAIEPPSRVSTVQSVLGSLVGSLDLDHQFRLETSLLERLASFIPYSSHIFVDIRLRLTLRLGFAEGLKLKGILTSYMFKCITIDASVLLIKR